MSSTFERRRHPGRGRAVGGTRAWSEGGTDSKSSSTKGGGRSGVPTQATPRHRSRP